MNLETFFEKFDQFADAPDAVAKMRELILWSAFSGAFSAEERDQPMPEEWAAEGAPTLPAIPSSWKWQRGRDVFDVIRGVSYKKNDASDSPVEGSFPVLRANNIGNGINFDGLVYVPRDNIREEQFVRRGDILIAMSSGSKKLVGKAAPIMTDFKGAFGAFCGIIRNKSAIPDAVLARYFQSPQYTSWVTAAGRGIGINNLGKGDLDSLPIPTPPLAEQKRIVAKVDELMALCDRLEAQQQERETRHAALARASLARFAEAPTPANLPFLFDPSYAIPPADLRKSILTLAVQGKLVPQDPNDEPAEKTFAGLKPFSEESSDGAEAPNQWACCTYRSLTTLVTSGSRGWKEFYAEKGSIFVRTQNIKTDRLILEDVAFVDLPKSAEGMRAQVLKDDILITITGANVTKAARVEKQIPEAYVSQHIALTRPRWSKMSEWLHLCFISHGSARGTLEQLAYGDKPGLNLSNVRDLILPIPPLAEQRRIVTKVEQLTALVDALETQLAASRATAAKLLEALLAELTSENRSEGIVMFATQAA